MTAQFGNAVAIRRKVHKKSQGLRQCTLNERLGMRIAASRNT